MDWVDISIGMLPKPNKKKAEDLKAYQQSLKEELEDVKKELASVQ